MDTHLEALDTAFLQLSFAIKLWHYLQKHPLQTEHFDIPLTLLEEDGIKMICLPDKEFNSYDDIILASENNISICFGTAAITLWEAINERLNFSKNSPNPMKTQKEKVAGLCFMIRCCFAHGPAFPVWNITKRYETTYKIGNKIIELRQLNGRSFDFSHIDGRETLWLLRAEASSLGLL